MSEKQNQPLLSTLINWATFLVRQIPGAKLIYRTAISTPGWLRAAIDRWRYGGAYVSYVFTDIYQRNCWGDPNSRSGPGSSLSATKVLRSELAGLLQELTVKRLLDIPCGDFHWMKEVTFPPGLVYLGGDIVGDLIETNNRLYGTDAVSFHVMDIINGPLPQADLVLCRDCLVHFSFSDVARAIRTLKNSRSTYLLVTHFAGDRQNCDISTGAWRPLRLTTAPFHFPEPLRLIEEQCMEGDGGCRDKSLALYRLADLPDLIQM